MLMLDTDVVIDVQREFTPALEWLNQLTDSPTLPGFAAMEIIQSARNKKELENSLELIQHFLIVWPSVLDCQKAYTDFASFHLSHALGLLDSLIGATAVGQNATLCTFNQKHYSAIPNLKIVKPYNKQP